MSKRIVFAFHMTEAAALLACLAAEKGYLSKVAISGGHLRTLAKESQIDLIVLDAAFPDGRGRRFAKNLRQDRRQGIIEFGQILLCDWNDFVSSQKIDQALQQGWIQGATKPPVSLEKLFEDIEKLLGAPRQESLPKLTFEFESKRLAALILSACQFQFTGRLVLSRSDVTKTLYFHQGHLVSASSNLSIDRIGNLLIAGKQITENQLNEALIAISDSQKRLGRELVDRGWVQERALARALEEQSRLIALSLFEWEKFEAAFSGRMGSPPEDVILDTRPFSLARLGIGRFIRAVPLQEIIDPEVGFLAPNPASPVSMGEEDFSEQERAILFAIDGCQILSEVLEKSPLSREETEAFVATLLLTGMVRVANQKCVRPNHQFGLPPGASDEPIDFSEEFFKSKGLPEDPNQLPYISSEELAREIRELDQTLEDKDDFGGHGSHESADLADEEEHRKIAGYSQHRADPVRYLLWVGFFLTALAVMISVYSVRPKPTREISIHHRVSDDVGGDLKPLFTEAIDLYNTGLEKMKSDNVDDLMEAQRCFILSLEIVPDYEPAQIALEQVDTMLTKVTSTPEPATDQTNPSE